MVVVALLKKEESKGFKLSRKGLRLLNELVKEEGYCEEEGGEFGKPNYRIIDAYDPILRDILYCVFAMNRNEDVFPITDKHNISITWDDFYKEARQLPVGEKDKYLNTVIDSVVEELFKRKLIIPLPKEEKR